jgi:hypothetical protein
VELGPCGDATPGAVGSCRMLDWLEDVTEVVISPVLRVAHFTRLLYVKVLFDVWRRRGRHGPCCVSTPGGN